jgi:hypothetical protein
LMHAALRGDVMPAPPRRHPAAAILTPRRP